MKCRILAVFFFLVFACGAQAQQRTADWFEFPVGSSAYAPTETYVSGQYHISQHFDTSVKWETDSNGIQGGARGAWCGTSTLGATLPFTDKATCEANSGKWAFGHSGNDLANGSGGGLVRAVTHGVVDLIETTGQNLGYGNMVRLRHVLPGGAIVYSMYAHLQDISVSLNNEVLRGTTIGHVGHTGTGANHLHLTIYSDLSPRPPGYVYYDNGAAVPAGWLNHENSLARMYDGLLFIDERQDRRSFDLVCCGSPTSFSIPSSVTAQTMQVENLSSDILTSIADAVSRGWIDGQIRYNNGSWVPTGVSPINQQLLTTGWSYGITALVSGIRVHYFIPGNHYKEERARKDMRDRGLTLPNVYRGVRESYQEFPYADPYSLISSMQFFKWNGTQWVNIWIGQAYSYNDPLVRWIQVYDNGAWSPWVRVY